MIASVGGWVTGVAQYAGAEGQTWYAPELMLDTLMPSLSWDELGWVELAPVGSARGLLGYSGASGGLCGKVRAPGYAGEVFDEVELTLQMAPNTAGWVVQPDGFEVSLPDVTFPFNPKAQESDCCGNWREGAAEN